MVLNRMVKVQETKSNVTVNIPKETREVLGISGGDTLLLSADTESNQITLKKIYFDKEGE
jgi:AbrB family looped-hinge helix DNA binding protein